MSMEEVFSTLNALKNLINDYRDGNFDFNDYSDESEEYEHKITTPPRKCRQIQQQFESYLEEKALIEKDERQMAEFDDFITSHYFSKWNSNLLRNLVMNKAGRIARANTPVVSDDHTNDQICSGSPQKSQHSNQSQHSKSPRKTYPNHKEQTSNVSGNHSDSYEEYYFSHSETATDDQCISTSSITDILTDKKEVPPIFNIKVGSSSSEQSNQQKPLNLSTNKYPISISPKHKVATPKLTKKARKAPKELNNSSVLLVREVITHVNPKNEQEGEYEEEEEIVYMYEEEEELGEEEEEE